MTIETILDYLNAVPVRATFGAVGEVLGVRPQSVSRLLGARRPEASWIVNGSTGEPTGYTPDQVDPRLPGTHVIRSGDELRSCLERHAAAAAAAAAPPAADAVAVEEAGAAGVAIQEAPATDAPVQEAPATDAPVQEAPATDAPVQEAPATDAPVQEAPQAGSASAVYDTPDIEVHRHGRRREVDHRNPSCRSSCWRPDCSRRRSPASAAA